MAAPGTAGHSASRLLTHKSRLFLGGCWTPDEPVAGRHAEPLGAAESLLCLPAAQKLLGCPTIGSSGWRDVVLAGRTASQHSSGTEASPLGRCLSAGGCWIPNELWQGVILSHWGRLDAEHVSNTAYPPDDYRCVDNCARDQPKHVRE